MGCILWVNKDSGERHFSLDLTKKKKNKRPVEKRKRYEVYSQKTWAQGWFSNFLIV